MDENSLAIGKLPAQRIAEEVGNDPDRFADLMRSVLYGDVRTAQLAATPMAIVIEASPGLAMPWLARMLALLDRPAHPTVYRSVMRSLQFAPLPKRLEARIFDKMLAWIADPARDIAPRAFAITAALRIVRPYPELANELRLVLEDVMSTGPGPAVVHRAKMAMRELE